MVIEQVYLARFTDKDGGNHWKFMPLSVNIDLYDAIHLWRNMPVPRQIRPQWRKLVEHGTENPRVGDLGGPSYASRLFHGYAPRSGHQIVAFAKGKNAIKTRSIRSGSIFRRKIARAPSSRTYLESMQNSRHYPMVHHEVHVTCTHEKLKSRKESLHSLSKISHKK